MTIEKYTELNKSYKKKLVFKYGADAGFFSEFNNLLLAVVYCLENKIQFCLYCPDNALLRYDKGWGDFFQPFCNEFNPKSKIVKRLLNSLAQRQSYCVDWKHRFLGKILKWILCIDYFSYDLWDSYRSLDYITGPHVVDEVRYDNFFVLYHDICRFLFRLSPECENAVSKIRKSYGIEKPYIGMHIRMGDKSIEYDLIPLKKYSDFLASYSSGIKTIYVMTDDYKIIPKIESINSNYNVITSCKKVEEGWSMKTYLSWSLERRYQDNLELLAKVFFLANSDICIGTYTSNPGMFLGLYMNEGQFFDVDNKSWTIT